MPSPSTHTVVDAALAYDGYAPIYDNLLRENRINAYMRKEMVRALLASFPPNSRLLELGCGTGDEALVLASHGCEVVAIDPSSEMLRVAQSKAAQHPFGDRVRLHRGRARDVGSLLADEPTGSFDGAYSSFALSYESDLDAVRAPLARLVRPNGLLVVAAMNRTCLPEWALSVLLLRPSLSGRRLQPSTLHKVGPVHTVVYSRTPNALVNGFAPDFSLRGLRALPAILPPHYANRPLRRWPSLMDALERIDKRVAGFPLIRGLGDHTVAVLGRAG